MPGTHPVPPEELLRDERTCWQKFKDWFSYHGNQLCGPLRRTWDWEGLGKLGELKALKSSYLFFLVVPIAAKFITYLPVEYKVPGTEFTIPLRPHLPFSWMLLYFSALSISVGNLLYSVFCPEVLREFHNLQEFESSKRGGPYLRERLRKLLPKKERKESQTFNLVANADVRFNEGFPYRSFRFPEPPERHEIAQELDHAYCGPKGYYFVRDCAARSKWGIRLGAALAYGIGLALLLWIAVQKLIWVLTYLKGSGSWWDIFGIR